MIESLQAISEFVAVVGLPAALLLLLVVGVWKIAKWFAPQIRDTISDHRSLINQLKDSDIKRQETDRMNAEAAKQHAEATLKCAEAHVETANVLTEILDVVKTSE